MLDDYHNVVGTLNEAETKLLDDHIQELWKVFKLGQRSDTILKWPQILIFSLKSLFNSALYLICQMRSVYS